MITKKQIRVLHVISSLDIKFGGPTNYIFQLVRKQIEIGLNSYILTTHEKKKNNDFSTFLKNKIYSFKSKNFRLLNYSRE